MSDPNGTISFATKSQAALYHSILKGQMSDGMWENTLPNDHWVAPCRANVRTDPDNIGRNFAVKKEAYRFSSRELISIMKDEMLKVAREALGINGAAGVESLYGEKELIKDLVAITKTFKIYNPKIQNWL